MPSAPGRPVRYRFAGFTLSAGHRLLLHDGRPVPIIPRYLDLLLLLVERRHQAVHRREILDSVWSDVVVSEGALTQAVRSLRRALDDDTREPCFIRTVARHGYQFIRPDVSEEDDDGPLPAAGAGKVVADPAPSAEAVPSFQAAIARLLAPGPLDDEERRDAAEHLHALGTARTLAAIHGSPAEPEARALLRETRWDVAGAGPVPILASPQPLHTAAAVVRLRLQRAIRLAERRWTAAVSGAAIAGLLAGALGGFALVFGPGSAAAGYVPLVLALVGGLLGGLGAAGVAAGLCLAEMVARSWRGPALVALGGLGGGVVGGGAHLVAQWTLRGLFGRDLEPIVGGLEGLVVGAATGLGYALSTGGETGGLASPRGVARWRAAVLAGVVTATAAVALALAGGHLGALSLDLMARSFPGSQVGLAPLARLLGERAPGRLTAVAISGWEGLMFAAGTVGGLTRRPPSA
ncbi:MAG TPA: winged helix-turn-helix domain-containing protein [Vicinamibacteria bacterium]|nr:winged helix-turn-helix domain-containing protein [Vicinamibacteria bacterium]